MAHPLAEVSNFSYDTLNKEFALTEMEKLNFEVFLKAYMDDFWQKGNESLLPPAGGAHAKRIGGLLEKRFVFRNIIKEVCGRVTGAFFGKAPTWRFQQNGEDLIRPNQVKPRQEKVDAQKVIDDKLQEIDKALGDFWTTQNVAKELGKAFSSRLAFGRGGWRIYIPLKFKRKNAVNAGGTEPNVGTVEDTTAEAERARRAAKDYVQFENIGEAIKAMRIEFVPPTQGRLLDDGGEYFSIVKYSVREDWQTNNYVPVIEFSFPDNSDRTFIGTVAQNDGISTLNEANLSDPLELNGLTTFGEFKGEPYVTRALYKNNQLVNLALTCAGFSLVDNGFGEMILTNVELATRRVVGPDGEETEVPTDIIRGGGAVQNFVGVQQLDDVTGASTRATPSVTFREPSPITAFKDGADLGYTACLQEAGQLYALISGDATASGESRIQALSDFYLKILPYKSEVDMQESWLMTLVMLLGAALAGENLTGYSVIADARVHIANLSTEEKTLVMAMRKDGVISRETERVLLGVEDPNLEADIINREQASPPQEVPIEDISERADLALKLLGLGVDQETLYQVLGFTPDQIALMKQRAADEQAALQQSIADAQAAAGLDQGGKPATNPGQGFGAGA